jgi:hypothetical protein
MVVTETATVTQAEPFVDVNLEALLDYRFSLAFSMVAAYMMAPSQSYTPRSAI